MPNRPVRASAQAMPNDARRGFLRGLMNLPLIGGSISLIGSPVAAAEPITKDLLYSYKSWLQMEHRMMCFEMASYDNAIAEVLERSSFMSDAGAKWHFRHQTRKTERLAGWERQPQPSSRAAVVLSAVGCDWRTGGQA
jgi:hypothetical protein